MIIEPETSFSITVNENSHWNLLKFEKSLIKTHIPQYKTNEAHTSSYDIVQIVMNEKGTQPFYDKDGACHILTAPKKISGLYHIHTLEEIGSSSLHHGHTSNLKLKSYMLGQFIDSLKKRKHPTPIKINPIAVNSIDNFLCEEILFAPIFDTYTQKYLMSPPDEARALLAMNPKDQKRWGLEIVFQTISNIDMPLDPDQREFFIKNKIQESHFVIPRTPLPRGSASIYCLILNLDNPIEEMAFIRDYKSFNTYTKVLYVNSNLEIITGDFKKVPYFNGDIDEIFGNLIRWYKSSSHS